MLGQLLDRRYQVIQVLGAGGFGQTYLAQDTRRPGNPICVVKHLNPTSTDSENETTKRLFNREAETLEQLGNHDRIPRLLAYFVENQQFYLVQEFVEGHPLSAELSPGQRWTESQVIQLLQEVLSILEFVHRQGVIHRDIKPDNIIRRQRDKKFLLVDFGAVKHLRSQLVAIGGQSNSTVAIGTPGYMPIEQGRGNPNPNSDIYALGMIAIQALTGWIPTQLQEDRNTGEILWQYIVPVSPRLAAVVTKMVRYHSQDRYQTATEVLEALQQPATAPDLTPSAYLTTNGSPGYYSPQPISTPHQTPHTGVPTTPVAPVNRYKPPVASSVNRPKGSGTDLLPLMVGVCLTAIVTGAGVAMSPHFFQQSDSIPKDEPKIAQASVVNCTVLSRAINVRSQPGGAILGQVVRGTQLSPTGNKQDTWVEINEPRQGWVGTRTRQGEQLIDCSPDRNTFTQARTVNQSATPQPSNLDNSSEGQLVSQPTSKQDAGQRTLEQAKQKYQSGDFNAAIALLKSIPATSSAAQQAEETITKWQQDWTKAEATLNEVQRLLNEGRWDEVLKYRQNTDLPEIRYWRDKLTLSIKEAIAKKLQPPSPSPNPTESPSPTAYPQD